MRFLWLALLIVFTLFIFFCSSMPASESGRMSGYVVEVLYAVYDMLGIRPDGDLEYSVRKLAHFMEFGGQAWLLCKVYNEFYVSNRASNGYILFFCLLTAVVDEYIQYFSPGRSCLVSDVLLDFGGAFCAWLFYRICQWSR